jgi:hypothetical protein
LLGDNGELLLETTGGLLVDEDQTTLLETTARRPARWNQPSKEIDIKIVSNLIN